MKGFWGFIYLKESHPLSNFLCSQCPSLSVGAVLSHWCLQVASLSDSSSCCPGKLGCWVRDLSVYTACLSLTLVLTVSPHR